MVSRRAFIGSAAGVAVVAGVGGYLVRDLGTTTTRRMDPVEGFTALTPQTTPPVQPDHEVVLNIRPRMPIPIPEFYFEPTGLFIQRGDTVKFNAATPHHTVTSFHSLHGRTPRIPSGVPPFSSPMLPVGSYWLYTFETEGVYDVFCGPHEYFGMVMRIVVGSPTGPGATAVPPPFPLPEEGAPLPPLFTASLILNDPALKPENIMSRSNVSWDALAPDNKRPLLAPTEGGP